MSYTPVREALIQLESEGLIETVNNQGVRLKMLTREELREKFELRIVLETGAAKLAAEKITDKELASLRQNLDEHRRSLRSYRSSLTDNQTPEAGALLGESIRQAFQLNILFHLGVIRASRNRQMAKLVSDLHLVTQVLQTRAILPGQNHLRQIARDCLFHHRILRALEHHDPEEAARWIQKHTTDAMKHHLSVYDLLQQLRQPSASSLYRVPEVWLEPGQKVEQSISSDSCHSADGLPRK